MFQEGDERRADADDLPGRNIHVIHPARRHNQKLLVVSHRDAVIGKLPQFIQRRVRLRDDVVVLVVGRQIHRVVGDERHHRHFLDAGLRQLLRQRLVYHIAVLGDHVALLVLHVVAHRAPDDVLVIRRQELDDFSIRRLHKTVFVDPPIAGKTANQADVRAFRRLNRADAPVMAVVHVAHVEARALAPQTAGAERRQRALVRQFRQRVRLLHKLRQLRRAEELANGRHDRADIHQRHRRQIVRLADRHALLDDALRPPQPHAQLVLNQLAHSLDATVAQMVNVVRAIHAVVDVNHALDHLHDVRFGDGAHPAWDVQLQSLVQLVTPHALQVITPLVEQLADQVLARVVQRGGVARTHTPVELQQGRLGNRLLFLQFPLRLHLQRRRDELVVGVGVHVRVQRHQLLVAARLNRRQFAHPVVHRCQRAQQNRYRDGALAIELDDEIVRFARLKFHPRAAIRNQLRPGQQPACRPVFLGVEVHPRRANQLAHHHALGAVDDKRALLGHEREVAHEDVRDQHLVARLAVDQRHPHVQRRGVGHIALQAHFLAVLRLLEPVGQAELLRLPARSRQIQLQIAVKALNRADFVE